MIPLLFAPLNKELTVSVIKAGKDLKMRLQDMGITKEKQIKIINKPGNGPILVQIDSSRVALGKGAASKIMVH